MKEFSHILLTKFNVKMRDGNFRAPDVQWQSLIAYYIESPTQEVLKKAIAEHIDPGAKYLITTRIDNDSESRFSIYQENCLKIAKVLSKKFLGK